jgi:pyruvate kinase
VNNGVAADPVERAAAEEQPSETANPGVSTERRTKIIATLGPASNTEEGIRRLIRAGADVFRLNFSHGSHEQHGRLVSLIRRIATEEGRYTAILADIQGPKIRLGEVYGTVVLKTGAEFTITTETRIGNEREVSTPFTALTSEVEPGHRILINDGLVELQVVAVEGDRVRAKVLSGGPIGSKKGMNFPDTDLTIPAITEKDRLDLRFVVEQDVDYVAASFIRKRSDIEELRAALTENGGAAIPLIAKLEKPQAIDSLDDILEVSDGVMVARGDLGVELPPERVPIVQKRILKSASQRGRIAITATQMLESMTTNARPTRAEASDVANAIFDGSDAVMLSGETASGVNPVGAVEMMARIARVAEQNPELQLHKGRDPFHQSYESDEFTDSLAGAARYAAQHIQAKYIVVFTQTGFTARLMSKFRPESPIIAFTQSEAVARRMNLLFGVLPHVLADIGTFHEDIVEQVERFLLEKKLVARGDRLVLLMGSPTYQRARTNLLRVLRVGGE